MKYYKLVNPYGDKDNVIYHQGYNEFRGEFNSSSKFGGGIHFASEDIFSLLSEGGVSDLYEVEPIGEIVKNSEFTTTWKSKAVELKYVGNFWDNVEFLVEQGANIKSGDANIVGFAVCVFPDSLNIIKTLVGLGADIHSGDEWALRNAADSGRLDVVKYLVEQGADIHIYDDIILHCAASFGDLRIVKYLIENGANIHIDNEHALRYAALHGRLDVVKYLIEMGADIHVCDDWAIHMASNNGQISVVKYLFDNGAHLYYDTLKVYKYLIDKGVNVPMDNESIFIDTVKTEHINIVNYYKNKK